MSILSQSKDAKSIAEETKWQELLEESFKEMNLYAGSLSETEIPVKELNARLSGFTFKVSLKIELERNGDE